MDKGEILRMEEIVRRTTMPEGTVRRRYHEGTMTVVWKLGGRLVAWSNDLDEWMREQQKATTKIRDGSAPTDQSHSSDQGATVLRVGDGTEEG